MSEKKAEFTEKLKSVKEIWKDKKLKKDNFLILILLGILFLVVIWPVSDTSHKETTASENESQIWDSSHDTMQLQNVSVTEDKENMADTKDLEVYTGYLESKLEEVLSLMDGAGKVKVMITLKSSGEAIIEKDTPLVRSNMTEVDAQGGSRNTSDINNGEETVYMTDGNGKEVPYVKKVTRPVIEGVIVAVQGGENQQIIQNITDAIKALFGIEAHKIKVVKMKSE